ncbi:hypothetical protein A5734_03690 [Mycolicibacterium fortuitum]|nr:hypothetical protein A5734_03690 [Mycolicibacterium fortuitum]
MAPIWEFAAIRIEDDGTESDRAHFQIRHRPEPWLSQLRVDAPRFAHDYLNRYDAASAVWEWDAARGVARLVEGGAVIAGSNPAFDMERLLILMQRNGISDPGWHYHPLDVPTIAVGWLFGRGGEPERPWKSDAMSRAVGVDPIDYARHTAMGDVEWSMAMYRAATGGEVW